MAVVYEVMIFSLKPGDLPTAFGDSIEFGNFIGAHLNQDLQFRLSSRRGSLFGELAHYATLFGLTALHWLNPLDNPDQEFDQIFYLKRVPLEQRGLICRDIEAFVAIARANPGSYEITSSTDPQWQKQMYDQFAEAVNSDDVLTTHTAYESDFSWDLLFAYLRTMRNICERTKSTTDVLLQVCIGG